MVPHKSFLENIFLEALPSINPKRLVLESLREKSFPNEKVYLIGFGKAAAGMAAGVIEYFGENVIEGIISVPVGTKKSMGTSYFIVDNNNLFY